MRFMALLAAALLCACEQRQEQTTPANKAASAVPAVDTKAPDARPLNEVETDAVAQVSALPPADRPLRFVGRWAVGEANCRIRAWRFTATSLDTPAGSHCDFHTVREVPGGFDIAARCTAEGPPTDDRITLRFAESAKGMLFESGAIADAGLIYCGE